MLRPDLISTLNAHSITQRSPTFNYFALVVVVVALTLTMALAVIVANLRFCCYSCCSRVFVVIVALVVGVIVVTAIVEGLIRLIPLKEMNVALKNFSSFS